MKLLKALLKEAQKSELDPSTVSASDVSAYVSQVKRALKGKQMTKGSVGSAVREIAEDDPKFGANPKALPQLVKAVCAKLCESIEAALVSESVTSEDVRGMFEDEDAGFVFEGTDDDDDKSQPGKFSANSSAAELNAQVKYLNGQIEQNKDNRMLQTKLKQALAKIQGFIKQKNVSESIESLDEDTQPGKFSASSSVSELKAQVKYLNGQIEQNKDNRVLQVKLKQALAKIQGFLKQKTVSESVENLEEKQRIDVDELSVPEIQSKLLAAAKAAHPDVAGMRVHADDKMMRVEVPGKDRCYATVSLTTGVVTVLKEGWDSETEEEEEVAVPAKKSKVSPRAAAAKEAKDAKECKEKQAVKETVEAAPAEAPAPKKVGRFMQAILDNTQTSK